MNSILFVCTANICRSPMAAGLFYKLLNEKGYNKGWIVESAGTWALDELPAADKTERVLRNRGIDIADHRSRSVNRQLLSKFDLILTMEEGQKEALKVEFPEYSSKIFLLSEMANTYMDINDPIGLSIVDFEDTAKQIEAYLESGFERIVELTKRRKSNN
jgi:protein-tyrosine phosphatase